jgi:hypothetical protein
MRQWFEDYGWRVGRRVRSDALAREREAYLSSRYAVGRSDWCAETLSPRTAFRRSRSERSFLVPTLTRIHSRPRRGRTASCRRFGWALSGSTGSERAAVCFSTPPRSSGAWDTTSKSSFSGPIRVASRLIRPCGRLDTSHKGREFQRFVEIVRSFHFGCQLSRVEASGISTLEYFASAYRSSRRPGEALSIPRAPACGSRSRLTENEWPRPSRRSSRARAICDDEEDSGSRWRGLPLGSNRKRDAEPA